MHLGFHIYDVGFQCPNVDAARPMVYMATALAADLVVTLINLAAIAAAQPILRPQVRRVTATGT